MENVDEFLAELTELSRKYKIEITGSYDHSGSYCPVSLEDLEGDHINGKYYYHKDFNQIIFH
jgi:hypothetical protein